MKKKLDCFGIVFNQPSYLPLNLHSQSKTSCVNAMYSLLEMGNFQPAMLYAMMCYVTTPKTASSPGKVEPQQHPKRPALRRPVSLAGPCSSVAQRFQKTHPIQGPNALDAMNQKEGWEA